jgi:hypothetical protein
MQEESQNLLPRSKEKRRKNRKDESGEGEDNVEDPLGFSVAGEVKHDPGIDAAEDDGPRKVDKIEQQILFFPLAYRRARLKVGLDGFQFVIPEPFSVVTLQLYFLDI